MKQLTFKGFNIIILYTNLIITNYINEMGIFMSDKNIKKYIEKDISEFHIPRWEEIPNIDLYMDQAIIILEKYLESYIDNRSEKIITKTMINNYVKQQILEPPVNKKYNREHIATLFVICILKQVYSIPDISELIKLALKKHSIEASYNKFCDELENSITLIFKGEDYFENRIMNKEIYLLRNVVLSFANKLYVTKTFLGKGTSSKENS